MTMNPYLYQEDKRLKMKDLMLNAKLKLPFIQKLNTHYGKVGVVVGEVLSQLEKLKQKKRK